MKSSIKKRFPLVRKPTFTGSTETGNKLMAQCAATVKKLSRELGGCGIGEYLEIKYVCMGGVA